MTKKAKNTQKISGPQSVLIILACTVFLLAGGWFVYNYITGADNSDETALLEDSDVPVEDDSVPEGWVVKDSASTGVSYAVPEAWGDEVKLESHVLDEPIEVGFGAPVYVHYRVDTKEWQTLGADWDGQPTVVRADNIIKPSDVLVAGNYPTASYISGDGPASQTRVMVILDDKKLQFVLPRTCDDQTACGDNTTTIKQADVTAALPDFIRSISL